MVRDGNEIAGTVTVVDPQKAYSFWKTELPAFGYQVTGAELAGGAGEIRFAGHGCVGNSQIAINGRQAVVQCELG